ncbi:MAG: hypothetical protein JXR12_06510 [Neptunomonas phycophila]|uniref:nucleoside 2-deoxyribosyltransferase domain-containing protein n=1 Tax=Neptunomonas phycophila TaxID=1572645 RepID=UPI003B8B76BF
MKVFLGGTCNGSKWRDELIEMLEIDYFNPVVDDWTPDCQAEEEKQRKQCDFCLYVLTPKMKGVYSIAEVVDDSNKRPEKTILCVLEEDEKSKFDEHQIKSMDQVIKMVKENGGKAVKSLKSIATYVNTKEKIK